MAKCKAALNGTSVKTPGPCKGDQPPPGTKGCSDDSTCGADQFCLFPTGQCSGQGQCFKSVKGGDFCPKAPQAVCGCDGKTYLNACKARSNKINIKSQGACKGPATPPMNIRDEDEEIEDEVEEEHFADYEAVAEVHVIEDVEDEEFADYEAVAEVHIIADDDEVAEGNIMADDYEAAAEEVADE